MAGKNKKYVYLFEEGKKEMKALLGGKGANLAEMTNIGLPVPPGFIITTEACIYASANKKLPEGMWQQVLDKIKILEKKLNKKFGDVKNPLLVSVRSGAAVSMPGMMDTVLNLGLNDQSVLGLKEKLKNSRFVYDAYRRFIMMFSDVVLNIPRAKFEHILENYKELEGVKTDAEISENSLIKIVDKYKGLVKKKLQKDFPQDVYKQLELAIWAVFNSWDNDRAITYRNLNKISHSIGTAVNIQIMVFGNLGETSATGVAFTRNPSTGEKELYGEFLVNAQGEDVVAGIRTPLKLIELKKVMPKCYNEFLRISKILEKHYRDMMDLEFTIEEEKLYMLQCRVGKRTAQSAVKVAVNMVEEKLINKKEALLRVEPKQIDQLLHYRFDPNQKAKIIAKGLAASPGAATGKVIFDADTAEQLGKKGEKVILVRPETCPDDIHGLAAAQGVLTARGGMTSHAAVVARGMGKPCVSGCESIKVDLDKKIFIIGGYTVKENDIISIDGSTGTVMLGKVGLIEPKMSDEFLKILKWADEIRKLGVRTNADTPEDAKKAFEFGAEGIGLCRTEHMFMATDRLPVMQEMIMAETKEERITALNKLLKMQRQDFIGIFQAMQGHPVTIRLLDPPLHEFLPKLEKLIEEVTELRCKNQTKKLKEKEKILAKVQALHEANPMLGLRGCRLGILYPEVNEMQVKAIFEAACAVAKTKMKVCPEVMIPLVGHYNELKLVREQLEKTAQNVMKKEKIKVEYKFGTMIEIPRAALTADEIAEYAEFFSFGTNDLTQTTFGYSRDDAEGKFLFNYLEKKILTDNPFQTLDTNGVGKLMILAKEAGRKTRKDLKLGICGEHGGDPASVEFCHMIGLNYVSCSPYRVPVARLAAAQAQIKEELGIEVEDATK